MVRKQLYITEHQDQALKQHAQVLGVSEAELVRRAIDQLLLETKRHRVCQRDALMQLLDNTQRLAQKHRLPHGSRFDREVLYADREQRQHRSTQNDRRGHLSQSPR